MRADKRVIKPEYEYILYLNESEALFLRELVNLAPVTLEKVLDGKYNANEIVKIKNMGDATMWKTFNKVLGLGD